MDDIYSKLGNPGRFQICMFLLLAMNVFPIVFNHVGMAFTAYTPQHLCHAPNAPHEDISNVSKTPHEEIGNVSNTPHEGIGNVSNAPHEGIGNVSKTPHEGISNVSNTPHEGISNVSKTPHEGIGNVSKTPHEGIGNVSNTPHEGIGNVSNTPHDGIGNVSNTPHERIGNQSRLEDSANTSVNYFPCETVYNFGNNESVIRKCSKGEWVYKLEDGESTIVSEWDLVCDLAPLPNIANAVFFVGVMLGGVVFGYLSDRFGRRPVILVTLYLPIAVGVGLAYVQHLETFIALRFVQGFLIQGLQTTSYVCVVEWFSVSHRTIAGCLMGCVWGLSVLSFGGIAYIMKGWRTIQLAISLPSILAIGYIWVIPESLRWLHARGLVKQTKDLIEKVAKFNKIPNPLLDKNFSLGVKEEKTRGRLLDIIRTPNMRRRSLLLFWVWFCANVGYYGLTLQSTNLAGNRYLNFTIGSCLECSAYAILVFVARIFGRRRPLVFYFFLAAVCCITSGVLATTEYPRLQMVSTAFAIAGKFAVGGLYSLMELFTTELYPTVVRNSGMGACVFCGRLGAVLAPQFLTLGVYTNAQLPVIIFGVLTLLGGVATLFLPETMNANLPDTIDEVQKMLTPSEVKSLITSLQRDTEVKIPLNSKLESSTV